jgi:segregation and condensation protein A
MVAEPVREGRALSAEDLAWEGQGRGVPRGGDVPVLRVAGFEGPLDWLLEQARAGRVDLARLPVLALVEQCVTALEAALARLRGRSEVAVPVVAVAPVLPASPVPLQRLADWVTMAAWLTELRSRLLLPANDPDAAAARDEAEALRRRLADRALVRAAAAWLDARPQLGRDVFAHGGGIPRGRAGAVERAADLPAVLAVYARLLDALARRIERAAPVYQPRPLLHWRVGDALTRITRLLPELLGAASHDVVPGQGDGVSLWSFLPDRAALRGAGVAEQGMAESEQAARLCCSAVASTLVAGLELARQGQLTLVQEERFGDVVVRRA